MRSYSSKLGHTVSPETLVSICEYFDNANNTVEMAQALSSFILLVHNQTLFRRQFSSFVHRNVTVQLSGLNPRKKLNYNGVDQPFYMHLLDIDERKRDLLAKVCQSYSYFPRTSVDPNKKLDVFRASEFGCIINRWVASVDLERLLIVKDIDILALYLLQHNIKGTIHRSVSEERGSASEKHSFGFYQVRSLAYQGEDVFARARQLLYWNLIQFQLNNPDIGSLDQVKIVSNFPTSRSAVYLAAHMYPFLVYLAGSEFRSPSNLYRAEAVRTGQVSGRIATELCGTIINDDGISNGILANKTVDRVSGTIEAQSYAYGRYIASSDLCRILIRATDVASMKDDDLQQEIADGFEQQEQEKIKVSDGVELYVSPFSKSKRYSLEGIKQKLATCIHFFGLECAARFREEACYSSAVTDNKSPSNQQADGSGAVASSAASSIFCQSDFPKLGSTHSVINQASSKS